MSNTASKFFSVMVVGENPDEILKKYDANLNVEPYIKYKYSDADKLKKNAISVLDEIVRNHDKLTLSPFQIDYFKERRKAINNMSTFEYYQTITDGLFYDKSGNALSEKNPQGKFSTYRIGKNFSLPLKLKDGSEAYQSINKNIDWEHMNMQNTNTYDIVWDLVHGNRTPHSEEEKQIYMNMKDKTKYFSMFKDNEAYVTYNCAYWNYAVVDEDGWHDLDDDGNEMEWISTFFEKYVANLSPSSKISIYECSKNND